MTLLFPHDPKLGVSSQLLHSEVFVDIVSFGKLSKSMQALEWNTVVGMVCIHLGAAQWN